jgi:hypothetical protein
VGSELDAAYRMYIRGVLDSCEAKGQQLGAFLMEPLMLGAGGLKFIDPLFQKVVVQECRLRGIPIVYDEVKASLHLLSSLSEIFLCVSEISDCHCECCKCSSIDICLTRYLFCVPCDHRWLSGCTDWGRPLHPASSESSPT